MATSPTPSLDSIRGSNSIESYGEHNGYLSDSPLTLSGSSPPVSDSAICDEYTTNVPQNQHHPISASVSSSSSASSSSSSSSGLSGCGSTSSAGSSNSAGVIGTSPGVIGQNIGNGKTVLNISNSNNNSNNSNTNSIILNGNGNNGGNATTTRCNTCNKSKQSDAVARCFECNSFLCAQCVAAHEYMNCFNGHTVRHFVFDVNNVNGSLTHNPASADFKYAAASSLTMMLQQETTQQQQQQQQQKQPLSQLSKIVLNSAAASAAAAGAIFGGSDLENGSNEQLFNCNLLHAQQQTQQQQQQQQQFQYCHRHKHELLKFSCRSCCTLICKECFASEHATNMHDVVEHVPDTADNVLQNAWSDVRSVVGELLLLVNNADGTQSKLKSQYNKSHNEINETTQFFYSMVDERKLEMHKELETRYNAKISEHNMCQQRCKDLIEKCMQACDAFERAASKTGAGAAGNSLSNAMLLRKNLQLQLQEALRQTQPTVDLEFVSNYQTIQTNVRNAFGVLRNGSGSIGTDVVHICTNGKQPPIARPNQSQTGSNSSLGSIGSGNLPAGLGFGGSLLESFASAGVVNGGSNSNNGSSLLSLRANGTAVGFDDLLCKSFHRGGNSSALSAFMSVNPYEKWSNGGSDNLFSNADPFGNAQLLSSLNGAAAGGVGATTNNIGNSGTNALSVLSGSINNGSSNSNESLMDLTNKLLSSTIYPPKSQIKRTKMIYHCKFGEFGVMQGQFTEPSGVAVNAQNDIIVADTNNHRIQIFDKEGHPKFQFGECGKRDSQLLYPNRVAVVRQSGDIIVTERSPTHQIQIYNQYGQFVRKFGANILQHPRGVTVDNKGRIIVVECKVMRVIIFDQNGNVLHKFGCSKHLEFPNGVVVNDKQEIFISDNRAHCVKVFNYEGQYLRQIGGEGITNYPIGVGINAAGEILIADNHNNFNLTIFTQDGGLVHALESKVKHAQCFDVALMDDGSVVLASKDYRLYIYRYLQVMHVGL